jgi:L-alanine-DL-glutamate epimerase-like enolase superfamily enzyme
MRLTIRPGCLVTRSWIAAIENALVDIAKALGIPVHELLGGPEDGELSVVGSGIVELPSRAGV